MRPVSTQRRPGGQKEEGKEKRKRKERHSPEGLAHFVDRGKRSGVTCRKRDSARESHQPMKFSQEYKRGGSRNLVPRQGEPPGTWASPEREKKRKEIGDSQRAGISAARVQVLRMNSMTQEGEEGRKAHAGRRRNNFVSLI